MLDEAKIKEALFNGASLTQPQATFVVIYPFRKQNISIYALFYNCIDWLRTSRELVCQNENLGTKAKITIKAYPIDLHKA